MNFHALRGLKKMCTIVFMIGSSSRYSKDYLTDRIYLFIYFIIYELDLIMNPLQYIQE